MSWGQMFSKDTQPLFRNESQQENIFPFEFGIQKIWLWNIWEVTSLFFSQQILYVWYVPGPVGRCWIYRDEQK